MMVLQPDVGGARVCAPLEITRQPAIKVRKIPKLKTAKVCKTALANLQASQASAVQLVLDGSMPEIVELIMGLIEPDPDKCPKEAQEQAMQGVLSWASLNRAHRKLFHDSHLKWWVALLKKHTDHKDPERMGRSVVPLTTGKPLHERFVEIYRNLVRERKEREKQEAEVKARMQAKMAHYEAERGVSIRVAEEPLDHFENTDQYQRWMFHQSKKDPRELELTKMMQRAERLVHHPKHEEDKSQSKAVQEMGKLLNALRTRRREWEVFRTSPRPFTQMLATLTEAVGAMEAAMDIPAPNQEPPPPTPPSSPEYRPTSP